MLALIKASLKSTMKSPSSIAFTIAFPLVFIFGFDFLGDRQVSKIPVIIDSSVTEDWSKALKQSEILEVKEAHDFDDLATAMVKGEVMAVIKARDVHDQIAIQKSPKLEQEIHQIVLVLNNIYLENQGVEQSLMIIEEESNLTSYNQVDFILPGQLGFSLLAASIFGTAFVFFNLRSELVLKRLFASPIKRQYILLAEATSRMIFQVLGALMIIIIGYYFLGFHLSNGWWTVFQMLIISALALVVFMSFGFMISGVAKNSALIPPLSNVLVLPQFILADTFIPIEQFPQWLESISKLLPLTNVNIALRKIAFEGLGFWNVKAELGIVLLWGIIGYAVAVKFFKWE